VLETACQQSTIVTLLHPCADTPAPDITTPTPPHQPQAAWQARQFVPMSPSHRSMPPPSPLAAARSEAFGTPRPGTEHILLSQLEETKATCQELQEALDMMHSHTSDLRAQLREEKAQASRTKLRLESEKSDLQLEVERVCCLRLSVHTGSQPAVM